MVIANGAVDAAATKALRDQRAGLRRNEGFGFNAARLEYEQVWTRATYARLITLLGRLPVEWRFFVKHRVFERIIALPPAALTGTGSEVERAFREVTAAYPQLREFLAAT